MSDTVQASEAADRNRLPLCPQWLDNPGNFPTISSPPPAIQNIPDSGLRQRAFDAWLCARRVYTIIDVWGLWFVELAEKKDADPGAALRLRETAICCVRALWDCGAKLPTLRRDTPEGVASKLPEIPFAADGEWQNDPLIETGRTRLRGLGRFQGELMTFMTLLCNSPSTAFLPTPSKPGSGLHERDGVGREQGGTGQDEGAHAGRPSDQGETGQAAGTAAGSNQDEGGGDRGNEQRAMPPGVEEFVCSPSGNGYLIKGFGESGHLKHSKGLGFIARLLRTPGEAVPMLELVGADDRGKADRRSPQKVLDAEAKKKIKEELRELRADLSQAQKENNTVEIDSTEAQIENLQRQLLNAEGLGGRGRDLNNPLDKLRPRIFNRLRYVYAALRKADPPMQHLAEHFEQSIASEGDAFIYRPGPFVQSWETSPRHL